MDQQIEAKPFLKWAGGKKQLLKSLTMRLPQSVKESGVIESYIEPFVGGGALFFHLRNNYDIRQACLMDVNPELIIGYKVVQAEPEQLVKQLKQIEENYLGLDAEGRESFYYHLRDAYNQQMKGFNYDEYGEEWITRASHLIFLNKTCFNGLFRQNQKGAFL